MPYLERTLVSRYLVVVKKLLKRGNGYARYILNGLLEECVFWLGEFSILLEPVYLAFYHHHCRALNNQP